MDCETAYVTVRGIDWPSDVQAIRYPYVRSIWSDAEGVQLINTIPGGMKPFRVVDPKLYYISVNFF